MLVLIGADADGKKELLAIEDGYRESPQSWRKLLLRLRDDNGLAIAPESAIGDGSLAFWKALHEVWPGTRQQRCWVHKTANVLNVLPKSVQGKAKKDLHAIYQAESRFDAEAAFNRFTGQVRREVRQGRRLPGQGSNDAARLLRLPRRALETRASSNPIESTFGHRAAPDRQDQGLPVARDGARDGL